MFTHPSIPCDILTHKIVAKTAELQQMPAEPLHLAAAPTAATAPAAAPEKFSKYAAACCRLR